MTENIYQDIGKILSADYIPCLPSAEIWAEAAVPAALKAAWTVIVPDKKEAFRLAFGKSWLKALKQVAHEVKLVEPIAKSAAGEAMFEIAEVADFEAWYLFLLSVAGDFLIDWSTLAMRMGGCTGPCNATRLSGANPLGGITYPEYGTWGGAIVYRNSRGVYPPTIGYSFLVPPGATYSLNAWSTWTNPDGTPVGCDMRIIDMDTDNVLATGMNSYSQAVAGNAALMRHRGKNADPINDMNLAYQCRGGEGATSDFIVPVDGRCTFIQDCPGMFL